MLLGGDTEMNLRWKEIHSCGDCAPGGTNVATLFLTASPSLGC